MSLSRATAAKAVIVWGAYVDTSTHATKATHRPPVRAKGPYLPAGAQVPKGLGGEIDCLPVLVEDKSCTETIQYWRQLAPPWYFDNRATCI